jgi:hypothetical protein
MHRKPSLSNSSDASPPFVFVHLPKNAGTTVRAALLSILLGPKSIVNKKYNATNLCVPRKVLCTKGSEPLAVIAGHMQYRLTTQVSATST